MFHTPYRQRHGYETTCAATGTISASFQSVRTKGHGATDTASCFATNTVATFAPGTDLDDPLRFCERHRPCQRPHCPRLCHTRDSGQPSPFCGAHYCEAADCEAGREGGSYCHAHTCVEPGCINGQESPRGNWAENTARITSASMMAVKLKWWTAGFARATDDAWGPAVGEEGLHVKAWDTPSTKTASTADEDAADELNEAINTASVMSVRFSTVEDQGLDHKHSITGSAELTLVRCFATTTAVANPVAVAGLLKNQDGAQSMAGTGCQGIDKDRWRYKMKEESLSIEETE
ncbi:hypothetical protein F66182_8967 [Fusarium sp. NRRL 66182]|nr:hypothetical protein F66182_8967 [Fusarium sp. NRRL 66182]